MEKIDAAHNCVFFLSLSLYKVSERQLKYLKSRLLRTFACREVSTTKNLFYIYTFALVARLVSAPQAAGPGEYKLFILITARGRNFHFIIKQTARNFKYFGVAPGHKCLGILSGSLLQQN
jgi:hypothetical protein